VLSGWEREAVRCLHCEFRWGLRIIGSGVHSLAVLWRWDSRRQATRVVSESDGTCNSLSAKCPRGRRRGALELV